MSVFVREPESEFVPAPEGVYRAVCCDVWPVTTEEKPAAWGGGLRDVTRVVWEIEEINPKNGKPFSIGQKYTASLHEKAKLREHLESWRGKRFTTEELRKFDLEALIGVNCRLQILHTQKDGKTYANVNAIMPLGKTEQKIAVSKDYIRKKDRPVDGQPKTTETELGIDEPPSDCPF